MAMGSKHFIFALLAGLALILAVHAQDQSGFISIACGLPANLNFTEKETGITYTSDAAFIDTGVSKNISIEVKGYPQQVRYLRSFPQGIRNCYTINVTAATRYLIRATFLHRNYDGNGNLPQFDLYLGANMWDTVKFKNSSIEVTKELIHVPSLSYIHVCLCLVNTSFGTPFISAIELRPLKNTSYMTKSGSLAVIFRWDIAGSSRSYRYPDDGHDRFWEPYNNSNWKTLRTNYPISHNDYQPASIVMSTAATPANDGSPLEISWDSENATEYYVYMYFAEVVDLQPNHVKKQTKKGKREKLKPNQSRSFNINLNGKYWNGPLAPVYLSTTTFCTPSALSGSTKYEFSIFKTENSTLPPIINAIEIYSVKYLLHSETDQGDVDAIAKIKSRYGIKRNWQGDPCAPKAYSWEGQHCSYHGDTPPRITSLNLSSSGLGGEIFTDISNLVMLQYLDLSNNNLIGPVPNFLSQLQYLRVLNLERNQLSGIVPAELIARSKNGSLLLSVCDNPNLRESGSCKKKKNSFVVPIVASLGGLLILSLMVAAFLLGLRRRKHQDETTTVVLGDTKSNIQNATLESIQGQFTYSQLLKITNNFKRILGKGGIGSVYHGNINDRQVAVKILSPSYIQRFQQFQSEVELLMRLHHRNLTSLVGYCCEGTNMGLIYEYVAYGDLKAHLSDQGLHILLVDIGEKANILNWEERLRIAMDAAQGLEYLHHGCKPPIIHGDVKSTNILLTENLCAKLADFSLSKIFLNDDGTYVPTGVGTPEYQDPEYYISNKLTEKTDIYSFGVVLFEIIASRHAIERSQEKTQMSQWLSSVLAKGDINGTVDPRLHGNFNINSAWKAVEIALDCLSPTSTKRPTITQVVDILNECLSLELARRKKGHKDETI